jgi:hypothetical protein
VRGLRRRRRPAGGGVRRLRAEARERPRPPTVGWSAPAWGPGLDDWFRWLVLDGEPTPSSRPRASAARAPAERRWGLYLAHGRLPAAHSDPHLATKATLAALEAWIAASDL